MATKTMDDTFKERWAWIRRTQKSSGKIYFILLGLVVLLIGINIGFHIVDTEIIEDDFRIGLYTELISIFITIFVLDQINDYRATQHRKLELFDQAKSRSNDMAIDALEKIRRADWWDEMLAHYLDDDEWVDLLHVQWAGGVDLREANLQQAKLREANLQGADLYQANLKGANLVNANLQRASLGRANLQRAWLWGVNLQQANLGAANLQQADLRGANLQQAHLYTANLQQADLRRANLKGADLGEANLQRADLYQANLKGADLQRAKFDETTILPDAQSIEEDENGEHIYDKYWTAETDMTRYTDPDHPDCWQPDWVKDQDTD